MEMNPETQQRNRRMQNEETGSEGGPKIRKGGEAGKGGQ